MSDPGNDFQQRIENERRNMVREQLQKRGIARRPVLQAMEEVPRHRFAPHVDPLDAYADRAWPIACGQTISQPYMVALMTQSLELDGTERVLEIGTGSGYQAAVLSLLAQDVVSIERHEELSRQAETTLRSLGYDNVKLIVGDGTLGWPEDAPYDRIVVTAASDHPPEALLDQLAEGGMLVMPVGDESQQALRAIRRTGNEFHATHLADCRFVPLIGAQGRRVEE